MLSFHLTLSFPYPTICRAKFSETFRFLDSLRSLEIKRSLGSVSLRSGLNYLFGLCFCLRAPMRPGFSRSRALGSRVIKPFFRRVDLNLGSTTQRARAIARTVAPSCPLFPDPSTLTVVINRPTVFVVR